MENILIEQIRAKVEERNYRFTFHASDGMTEADISVSEVEEVLLGGADAIGTILKTFRA